MMLSKLTSLLLIATLSTLVAGEGLYSSVKSHTMVLNQKNFDAQVTNNRHKGISIVNFYKDNGTYPLF